MKERKKGKRESGYLTSKGVIEGNKTTANQERTE